MTLLYAEGFEQFDTSAELAMAYGVANSLMSFVTDTVTGRGKALRLTGASGTTINPIVPIPPQPRGTIIGFAAHVRRTAHNANFDFVSLREGVLSHGVIAFAGEAQPNLKAAALNQVAATSMTLGAWHHIEAQFTVGDTGGYCELRLDGKTVCLLTGDTQNAGAGVVDSITPFRMVNNANNGGCDIDNIVVYNNEGDTFNDWLGDVSVDTLLADADGTVSGWAANTGTAWEAVRSVGTGDDAYISASEGGDEASFSVSDLPFIPSKVLGVQAFAFARKDDTGVREISLGVDSNGEVVDSPSTPLGVTYSMLRLPLVKNPDGDVEWTAGAVDDLMPVVKVTA